MKPTAKWEKCTQTGIRNGRMDEAEDESKGKVQRKPLFIRRNIGCPPLLGWFVCVRLLATLPFKGDLRKKGERMSNRLLKEDSFVQNPAANSTLLQKYCSLELMSESCAFKSYLCSCTNKRRLGIGIFFSSVSVSFHHSQQYMMKYFERKECGKIPKWEVH
jgi:hypothetical protein